MYKYICPAQQYLHIWWLNTCNASLFLEVALFNTQWWCDVSLIITAGIKQKNIISKNWTGLNGFTAEYLLHAMKYKCHCHLMLDAVNKLPVIKILILKSLKIIVLRIWLRSRIWAWFWMYCGSALWRWQRWYNHLLELNPSKFQKVTKYALFYSSVIVLKISREFFAIAAVRDPSVLDI